MHRRLSSRATARDTSPYKDSSNESEKRTRALIDDDEYQDPSTKRAKPAKRIRTESQASQAPPLTVAAPSIPEPGIGIKADKHPGSPIDNEHQDSLTQRGQSPTQRVKTEDQDSNFLSAVATPQNPEPDMDGKPKRRTVVVKIGSEVKPGSPSRSNSRKSKTVEQRVAAVERQVAEIKRNHRKETEKMTARRLEDVGKVTDDIIERQWVLLDFNINSIAIELSAYLFPKPTKVLAVLRTRLPITSSEGISQKTYENMKRTFLKSFMWNFVYTDFFLGRGSPWKGGIVQEVQRVRRTLIENREDTESRAKCAKWLSQAHHLAAVQPNEEVLAQVVHEFADTLLSMVLSKEQQKCRGQLKANLDNVVRLATDLTRLFLSSKALLVPDWPHHGSTYRQWTNSEIACEDSTEEESRNRYLVKSPALEKYGNADGENHHLSTVLRKPQIVYY
ncbi:hypothetical protein ISF_03723 [Cordyceps fumosorosea ARSEF 2679]|uniref:Uncharacterized protein n=1 Tax=Cordyceps fumosorosea (strain ARSEF 2679) TaxID=1081104 RepID=A0A167ZI52_CORFA|nr:hypothetical protein ISF_03723 [Cordyceps fumosorosea ARSEF 2679]OAA67547.1 hypothetical protein ISF_03723 [Cordyceps fumosorosea ARSEF 2679]